MCLLLGQVLTNNLAMQFLVSSNEWPRVKHILKDEGLSVNINFDFQMFTNSGVVAAERKRTPGDLLASVTDGRLAKECLAMREEADFRFLISEGRIKYTEDGHVVDGKYPSHWTRTGIRNLFRSIRFVEEVDIEFSLNIPDTVQVLRELQGYFDNTSHGSFRARPSIKSDWPVATYEEMYIYWIQGLPGISRIRAISIASRFGSPGELFAAAFEEWMNIPRFGKKTVGPIYQFLHGGSAV